MTRRISGERLMIASLLAGGALLSMARASGASPATRVLESAGDHVVIEVLVPPPQMEEVRERGERFTRVTIDGATPWGKPGEPGVLSMPLLVGVPSGARPPARVLQASTQVLTDIWLYPVPAETVVAQEGLPAPAELFRWDRAAYDRDGIVPDAAARVTSVSRMRFQEIATVLVFPVRARPLQHEVEIASRIVIEVRWSGGGLGKSGMEEPAPADERWEGLYRGLLANPDQARPFRGRPARRAADDTLGPRKAGARAGTSPEWKLAILETGLYRLPFESLASKGFPSGVPVSEIRVFQRSVSDSLLWAGADPFRSVEIPLDVTDAGGDGQFGPGDAVLVYLRDFREQFMPGDYEDMFTTRAVYWLTFTSGEAGARVTERPGSLGYVGLTEPTAFPSKVHLEPDVIFNPDSPSANLDLWFAVNFTAQSASLSIDTRDRDPNGSFRFRAAAVGRTPTDFSTPHRLSFAMNGTPFTSFDFQGKVGIRYEPDTTFSSSLLANGSNTLLYTGSLGSDPTAGSGAYLDWVELDYDRFYKASNNRLAFSSGADSGQSQFHVQGFNTADVRLYDVTDPLGPVRVVVDSLESAGGATTIHFQADVTGLRRFEAATPAGARTVPDSLLTADTPSTLVTDEADHVMIAYDDFAPGLSQLATHRQAGGMRVKVARLSDVYDEWNGGMPNPAAIRRYMKYALLHWGTPPTYLLLVGDGSEDHARRLLANDIDYMPSHPVFESIAFPEAGGDRWNASDNWFVLLDGPRVSDADNDDFLDIMVGRFSAGSVDEVSIQVAKTVAYEQTDFQEDWRRRYVLIADDAWITGCPVPGCEFRYCNCGQTQFEQLSVAHAAQIDTATTISLDPILMKLSTASDPARVACDDDTSLANGLPLGSLFGGPGNTCVVTRVRQTFTNALLDTLNQGALFVSYQGHGNRNVLSHESLLLDGFNHLGQFGADVPRFESNGRPFVFMAYGCSISEFERAHPGVGGGSLGDALPEKMMAVPNGGSVGVIGSTGIEFLGPNLMLDGMVLGALLAGGSEPPPRFILGDVFSIGMGKYSAGGEPQSMRRYVLFGDPALNLRLIPASYTVLVDGQEVSDGYYLAGHTDGSPVRITVASTDSTVLAGLVMSRSDQPGPVTPSSVRPDSVVYLHDVEFAKYDLVITAPAVGGGTRRVTLKVDVQTSITFDGREIVDGDLVDPSPQIVVFLTAPLQVAANEITVKLDDAVVAATPDSVGPRSWRITLPPVALTDGEHTVEVSVFSLSKTQRFSVQNKFEVREPLNYPNPMRGETTSFSYILTADVNSVEIGIYTVNGRKIKEFKNLPGRAGYNPAPGDPAIVWDGHDVDGDDIANGVYLYRVRALSSAGTAEAIGKLVILRGGG